MLQLQTVFNLESDVLPYIAEKRRSQGYEDECLPLVTVIGQEQDGDLIYTWTDFTPYLPDVEVSHIGLYELSTRTNKTLFIHDKNAKIVNATLSQEHTFLGFVTVEETLSSDGYGKQLKQDLYRGYLAEIEPQNRVFYLNLERSNYLQLQFLYGQYKGQTSSRESHLLVLLHKESIGLYHIPVARAGDKGVILSGEPKKEQIFNRRFIWSEWEAVYQRLHVAHFRKQGKMPNGQTIYKPYLTTYQFSASCLNEFVLDVPLDLPIPYIKSSANSSYLNLGPCRFLPETSVNMAVVSQPSGTYCVCFQHPLTLERRQSEVSGVAKSEKAQISLQYSVCMVHHGKILHCITPKISANVATASRIYFCWLKSQENVEEYHKEKNMDVLVPYIRDRNLVAAGSGLGLFDCTTQQGFKMTLNRDALVAMFEHGSLPTRLAILHHAVVHAKDLSFLRSLFHLVASDIFSSDIPHLLEEFLISSTYANLRKQIDRQFLKHIAFTNTDTMKGIVEKYRGSKKKQVSVSYSIMGQVALVERRHKQQVSDDLWENLARHIKVTERQEARFSSKQVASYLTVKGAEAARELVEDEAASSTASSSHSSASNHGFFRRLTNKARSAFSSSSKLDGEDAASSDSEKHKRSPSRLELILGPLPPYLTSDRDDVPLNSTALLTQKLLIEHLSGKFRHDQRGSIPSIASQYTTAQLQQSHTLGHLIWSALAPSPTISNSPLCDGSSMEEQRVFFMLEHYLHVLQNLAFPQPPAFPLYFTRLAFRSLQFHVFLQYVDRQVIVVTPDFVKCCIREMSDDVSDHVKIKLQLLSFLPQRDAVDCALMWNHPQCRHFVAKAYTTANLIEDKFEGWISVPPWMLAGGKDEGSRNMGNFSSNFPSLDALLQLLQQRDALLSKDERGVDEQFIADAAIVTMR